MSDERVAVRLVHRSATALVMTAVLPFLAAAAPPNSDQPIYIKGRPWAPFISPMGEPFRPRSATDDTLERWFNQADTNHDGLLTPGEMQADADRYFVTLDSDGDGEVGPEELIHYEWELAPDIQVNSRLKRFPGDASKPEPQRESDEDWDDHRRQRRERSNSDWQAGGLEGAARYGLLNMPEPVAAADADFNRAITRGEFRQAASERFHLLDSGKHGRLALAELEAMRSAILSQIKVRKRPKNEPDARVGAPLPPDH